MGTKVKIVPILTSAPRKSILAIEILTVEIPKVVSNVSAKKASTQLMTTVLISTSVKERLVRVICIAQTTLVVIRVAVRTGT